ncbi:hypothetical protein GCM10025856_09840 [Methylophaga marina]|uniref:Aminoglycoside phosphotransferase domain-containing protein n=1 Tax=Methylophaga marina TaxID=45495 RepID=A0ABN0T515_9GAMM|nr:hypothetical protein [Methylophaga marina]BDZ73265.1 hypothetical protein GCM10025856_09840 [Methylophaga marina]
MYSYPELSRQQQESLPVLHAPALPLDAQFPDSTHQLSQCDTADGKMILKVCHQQRVQDSMFWLGINHLFQLDFPNSLGRTQSISQFLQREGWFAVPEVVAEQAGHYVLVRYLEGVDLSANQIDNTTVTQLAHHWGKLHQHLSTKWGSIEKPIFSANDWPIRLEQTIQLLSDRNGIPIPADILKMSYGQCRTLSPEQFVPIMPDFRWDQLRQCDDGTIAVLDLDAFVRAPRELEWVLLEYLLSPQHAKLFVEIYTQYQPIPDLSACRLSYRVLLFLMNVLGESKLKQWLEQPPLFDLLSDHVS